MPLSINANIFFLMVNEVSHVTNSEPGFPVRISVISKNLFECVQQLLVTLYE